MGQSSSRNRASRRPPPPPTSPAHALEASVRDDAPPTASEQPNTVREGPSTAKRSRHSSFRRSILGLLPSNSSSSASTRTRKESETSSSEARQLLRKRWRSSKRWSKAPAQIAELAAGPSPDPAVIGTDRDAGVGAGSTLGVADIIPIGAPSHSSRTPTPSPATRSPSPCPRAPAEAPQEDAPEEQPQHASHPDTPADSVLSPAAESEPAPAQPATIPSIVHPTTEDIEREVNEFLHGTTDDPLPERETELESSVPPNEAPAAAEAPSPQTPSPRHFPPPGTLVVVQGVVNTTDSPPASHLAANHTNASQRLSTAGSQTLPASVSRHRSLSALRPGTRSGGPEDRNRRNRLSSLMRPSTMLGRGSADNTPRAPTASLSVPDFNNHSDSSSSRDDSGQESASSATSVSDVPLAPSSESASQRGLSQGSIDVLGTLLSVAAAATAASLFSPGLPFNNQANGGVPSLNNSNSRPLSPTPTAGLGALGGLGGLPGLGLNPAVAHSTPGTPQDSRDRIRNMWENIRERVGFNTRNGNGATTGTGANADRHGGADDAAGNQRMRPGELMLAEMARALNAGLGLANPERRTTEPAAAPAGAPNTGNNMVFAPVWDPSQPPPPDGSFERFLFNLQSDLRTVLSDDGAPIAAGTADSAAEASSPRADASPEPADEPVTTPELTVEGVPVVIGSDGEDNVSERAHSPRGSESEDGFAEDEDEEEDERDVEINSLDDPREPAPRTPTPIPLPGGAPLTQEQRAAAAGQPDASGRGEASRPAINLWRVYRFDAIPATQTQDPPAPVASPVAATDASSMTPAAETVDASLSPASTSTSVPSSPHPSSEPEPSTSRPAPLDLPANFVVPVIVVGLQSVDVSGQDEGEDEGVPPDGSGQPDAVPSADGAAPGSGAGTTGRSRGRTWHSRAANALRTFRSGRRGSSRGRQAAENSGSRTFLIYVIGGYYPPNHHMVTGSDTLDSYEALWELAELLGQVKPPTATKEEIDKSGLEIIKSSDLRRLEKDGRVASNCVERCLICLDDYGSEDDLRLMTCRHTFHKDCVDKWLQVGRNNCPACRTKGVSLPDDTRPSTPTQSETQADS